MNATVEDEEIADAMEFDAENEAYQETSEAQERDRMAAIISETERVKEMRRAQLEDLQDTFKNLTLLAQAQLQDKPRSTQLTLTKRTRKIYADYAKHGSMLGLKKDIADFLAGDRDEVLRYSSADHAPQRHVQASAGVPGNYDTDFISTPTSVPFPAEPTSVPSMRSHVNPSNPFIRYNSPNEPLSLETTLLAFDDSDNESISGFSSSTTSTPDTPHPSTDAETLEIVRQLPFRPSNVTITFPSHLSWPPGLLKHICNILELKNAQAKAMLFHHANKYLHPSLTPFTSPSSTNGLSLLRLGISSYFSSQVDTIFDTANTHPLGLSPETRKFLRQMYEKHPSLNPIERQILARATRVQENTIREFWEDMTFKRRGWLAMRVWIAARELEISRWAKSEGRF